MFNQINDNVVKILGIDKLPAEEQKETMKKLVATVYEEVLFRALEIMSNEDKESFDKLMGENPDPEKMFTFLATKVPNIDTIAYEEAEKVKDEDLNSK